jgi:hypothetical protein
MDIEQRKYTRFSVQDYAFAALRSGFEKVGKVHNISKKGLSFSYYVESNKAGSAKEYFEVDIFLSGNGFHVEKVPCKIIYDIQDRNTDENRTIIKRRCGCSFGELIKSQSELLELFLKNYTIGQFSS